MGLQIESGIVEMSPGPYDVHAHPRALDPITAANVNGEESGGFDGKAGLPAYTETALLSGFVLLSAMPNEFYRRPLEDGSGETEIVQFPISNADKASTMAALIRQQSRMLMTYHLGLDPKDIITGEEQLLNRTKLYDNFRLAGDGASALKVFGDISTGGNNVPTKYIPEIASSWHARFPEKPVIMHLEDGNVLAVLEQIFADGGQDIPVHIAHVSSKQELEAVIWAKQQGMNVTCEVAPHHLFASQDEGSQIGGYGCMKPTLKQEDDIKFLWGNLEWVDIFASDCAPHKVSDKEANPPAFGVTNHTTMLPLLFGAVGEGRLTIRQLYEKIALNPRKRFNVPERDKTRAVFDLNKSWDSAEQIERRLQPMYGQNIFPRLEALGKKFHLLGHVVFLQSGKSRIEADTHGYSMAFYKINTEHLL